MDSYYYLVAEKEGFKGPILDTLLAEGYYRMQHMMFTCNETPLEEGGSVIPVFWLRTLVQQCRLNKQANTIIKKCSGFSVSIQPAYVDDEIESLFALYKTHVSFSVATSCADYLHEELLLQPFDSLMVQVRDQGRLIATGYFDEGQQSIAGIMNIYHPQYRTYSLGKFLMLQKLQYALANNKAHYYTGYISPSSTRFDYKIFPDPSAVEIWLPPTRQWLPFQSAYKMLQLL